MKTTKMGYKSMIQICVFILPHKFEFTVHNHQLKHTLVTISYFHANSARKESEKEERTVNAFI